MAKFTLIEDDAPGAAAPRGKFRLLDDDINLDPTAGNTFAQNALIGAGKFTADFLRGGQQLLGIGNQKALQTEIAESRELDKPLMNTAGGTLGYIAPAFVSAAIPGANTVTGAAAIGAGMGALQPTLEGESRLQNTVTSGALGGAGQKIGQAAANAITRNAATHTAERAAAQSMNAPRDATIRAASDAGYVLPPSAVGGSWVTRRLESVAGKAALQQAASVKNQGATNSLARKALGLPDDAPLSEATIESVRQGAGGAYRDVASLSQRAADALERLKEARFESKTYWSHFNRSGDPASLKTARALDQKAGVLERLIEREARSVGRPELVDALDHARQLIARTYDVEKALNAATGDVSAKTLAAAMSRGRPLSGELATAANFAKGFGSYAGDAAKVPTPGVSKVEAATAALLGVGGYGAMGPEGGALAALPLASGPVRALLLRGRAAPTYSTPALDRLLTGAAANDRLPRTLQALLPGVYATSEQAR